MLWGAETEVRNSYKKFGREQYLLNVCWTRTTWEEGSSSNWCWGARGIRKVWGLLLSFFYLCHADISVNHCWSRVLTHNLLKGLSAVHEEIVHILTSGTVSSVSVTVTGVNSHWSYSIFALWCWYLRRNRWCLSVIKWWTETCILLARSF